VKLQRRIVGVLGFTALCACSLAINLDPLQSGVCGAGEKACDAQCVLLTDPDYGCASTACAPCTLPNATAICTPAGTCTIGACIGSYLDCDHVPENGCETDAAHDPLHCGSCTATPCQTTNGTPGCAAGHCSTGACNTGFGDCNGDPADGCEANLLTDAMNCGACKAPCLSGQTCQQGLCI
jgi:hypothetical protein